MNAEVMTLVNGEVRAVVSVHDRGMQYGDGIFETIAVHRGVPLLWDLHVARLMRGAQRLGISPPSIEALAADANRLGAGVTRAVLKVILTRGIGGRGYTPHHAADPTRISLLSPWPDYPVAYAQDGVTVRVCDTRLGRSPRLAGIKHLNRLEQVLARAEWNAEYAEGLMCDEDGHVIEGTMSNLFVAHDSVLRTPDLAACGVDGIMRSVVMDAAREVGVRCDIGRVTPADIESAQELFLTNSLIGVWPIRRINNKEYAIGRVTRAIQEAVRHAHCYDRD